MSLNHISPWLGGGDSNGNGSESGNGNGNSLSPTNTGQQLSLGCSFA